jgi:4-amino-4-deoxy-L-arabinose transferase-like glycosyltransferase
MRSSSWLAMTAVAIGAGLLFGLRLGERALWSEEVRWAQIPREMLASGDGLHPTLNGRTYYDKPLGSYWLVLAATWIRGQADVDEIAARLPSAVAGILGVVFLMAIARRLYDDRTAIVAGLILATEFAYVGFARTAAADAENVAGILAALWIYVRHRDRSGPWVVALWIVMALTSLTKGLLGFALPILVIGLDRLFDPAAPGQMWSVRRALATQRWLLTPWSLVAVPLAALVYLGPFLLSYLATGSTEGLQMAYRENLQRFYAPASHHEAPVWYYLGVIFVLAAPWSLLLPAALWQHLRHPPNSPDERRSDRFTTIFFFAIFLFFTAAASRRSYYLLPILPATALLIGRLLTTPADRLLAGSKRWMVAAWLVLTIVVLGAGAAMWPDLRWAPEPWNRLPPLPEPRWYVLTWLVSLAAIGIGCARLGTGRIAGPLAVIAIAGLAYLNLAALPAIERYRTGRPFAAQVRHILGDDWPHLAYYRNHELVYYLAAPGPIAEYDDLESLREAQRRQTVRFVLVRSRDAGALAGAATVIAEEPMHPWDDATQRGDRLLLMAWSRPR